ncbi:MAG: MBL fold metallo-hydrolase [Gammaproteobacteria bacterium]
MRHTIRQYSGLIALVILFLPVTNTAAQQLDFDKIEIKTHHVRGNIHMLEGAGGNIGVSAGGDAVYIIDDQFAPLTDKIQAAIAAISEKPVKFVINTHWHFDHTGGNENFGKAGAVIVAHDNVYERMTQENFIRSLNRKVPPSPKAALPVISFSHDVTFHVNGEDTRVFHVAHAHTDGDSVVHFPESNVVHTGDTWFHGNYPFIDISSGGSIDGMIAAVEKILALVDDDTRIIPGHGPMGDRSDLEDYLVMLKTVRDRIQDLIHRGKSLEEVLALKPNADYDSSLGNGFINPEQFLEIVYNSLMGE